MLDCLLELGEHSSRVFQKRGARRRESHTPRQTLEQLKAELAFEGVPVGPFRGRDAIAAAYREQPPDDEVRVLGAEERADGLVVARYAWTNEPDVVAGELRLTRNGGTITRLVVTFGQG